MFMSRNRNHAMSLRRTVTRKQAPAGAGTARALYPTTRGSLKEQILRFFGRDAAPFPVLLDIAIIPVEPLQLARGSRPATSFQYDIRHIHMRGGGSAGPKMRY